MTLNQAIETAKAKAADSPRWLRAIDRAAAGLESADICVTLFADDTALVTTPNNSHVVNGVCDCAAAQHGHKECVHRAAKRLTEMLESDKSDKPMAAAATSRAELISEIKSRWSAKFPHDHLADALMYRFKVNSLSFLADGWLQDILAAIA